MAQQDQPSADPVATQPVLEGQAEQDQMVFNFDRGFVYFYIAPEQAQAFETVLAEVKKALASSDDAARQRQAAGWNVIKIDEAQQGNVVYMFNLNPAVRGVTYDLFKILGEALPAGRVLELYEAAAPGLKQISFASYSEVVGMSGMN